MFGEPTESGRQKALVWVLRENPARFFYQGMGGRHLAERNEWLWEMLVRKLLIFGHCLTMPNNSPCMATCGNGCFYKFWTPHFIANQIQYRITKATVPSASTVASAFCVRWTGALAYRLPKTGCCASWGLGL